MEVTNYHSLVIAQAKKDGKPSFARIFAITMLVLAVLFTVAIWLPTWLILGDGATGIGVGLMCAFWGAPGFGVMLAGAIWAEQSDGEIV